MAEAIKNSDWEKNLPSNLGKPRVTLDSIQEAKKLWNIAEPRISYGTIESAKLNKRLMFKTPFGKYIYGHNASQYDSYMDNKTQNKDDDEELEGTMNNTQMRLFDYLEGNIDFPLESNNDPVWMYIKHRKIYLILLFVVTIMNIIWTVVGLKEKKSELKTLTAQTTEENVPSFLSTFLEVFLAIDMIVYLVMFFSGCSSFFTNKSGHFNFHSYMWVSQIIVVVFLSYIHQIYLIVFLIRIVFYIYVRYVISLLHTILLIPTY